MSSEAIHFQYRPVIKKIYYGIFVVTVIALLILLRVNIVKLTAETYLWTTIKLVLSSLVPLSILFRLYFFVRPIIFSKYKLEGPFLFILSGRKEKKIDLEQVCRLSFTLFSPRFFGGYRIELPSGEKFRFLSFLQNNHKVVEFLAQKKPELMPDSKYEKYIVTSQSVLISWKRILWRLKKVPFVVLKFFVFPGIFFFYCYVNIDLGSSSAFSQWERLTVLLVTFLIINFLLAFLLNHFEENILNGKTSGKNIEELDNWDFKQENIIFYSFQAGFVVLSGALLYLLSQLFIKFLGS